MNFPDYRARRMRRSDGLRRMVRETRLSVDNLCYPLFVVGGSGVEKPISSMPGQSVWSVDKVVDVAAAAHDAGIPSVLLFGIPDRKDAVGSEAWSAGGAVQKAIRAIKKRCPELVVAADSCFCEYTDHGHCGLLNQGRPRPQPWLPEGYVLNDETLEVLGRVAVSHAEAGADMLAPSGMLDGTVAALRAALDGAGFAHLPVLSYAVKYASAFYGPFRQAAESPPRFGDRRAHQMDPANGREALREAALDLQEGADLLMVKPALPYLDVLARLRQAHPEVPLAAYHVSGEYAMLKAAAGNGWLDERASALESLTAIKRAGADLILTYYARQAAAWLAEDGR